jgi:two-component system chemotaxis response regulator CheB
LKKIKVLIVDDSELIRQLLTEIISSAPDLEVVATAEHPLDAREKIKQFNPDVLTLDIEMPKMDGITFLRNLMRLRPMSVVMISTLTQSGAPATLDALAIGAVDYIAKPQGGGWDNLAGYTELIQEKVRNAARANLTVYDKTLESAGKAPVIQTAQYAARKVIAIGSSTGGTEALRKVLHNMPENAPPILLAQHIPAAFSASLALRLDGMSRINVLEAENRMPLAAGHAYLAPGDQHLDIVEKNGVLFTRLSQTEKVNGHRPSVDVLFHSVAAVVGKNAVGVILTGMGNDGAAGLKAIRDAGGTTFAQDEQTSVVWGMPGSAVRMNAVEKVLPIQSITQALMTACVK